MDIPELIFNIPHDESSRERDLSFSEGKDDHISEVFTNYDEVKYYLNNLLIGKTIAILIKDIAKEYHIIEKIHYARNLQHYQDNAEAKIMGSSVYMCIEECDGQKAYAIINLWCAISKRDGIVRKYMSLVKYEKVDIMIFTDDFMYCSVNKRHGGQINYITDNKHVKICILHNSGFDKYDLYVDDKHILMLISGVFRTSLVVGEIRLIVTKDIPYEYYLDKYTNKISYDTFIEMLRTTIIPVIDEIRFAPNILSDMLNIFEKLLSNTLARNDFVDVILPIFSEKK